MCIASRVGILVIVAACFVNTSYATPPAPPAESTGPGETSDSQRAWIKTSKHIQKADKEIALLEDECVKDVIEFLAERKEGAKKLASKSLSWDGKSRYFKSFLPWARGDEYQTFLTKQFKKHVFKEGEITEVIQKSINKYLKGVEDIERRLLVDLRADLDDLPASALPALKSEAEFNKAYERLLANAQKAAKAEADGEAAQLITAMVGGEAVTFIAFKVLQGVATQLGIKGTIYTLGAGGSLTTAGLSLAVAVAADYIIDWVFQVFYNPEAELAAKLQRAVEELSGLITEGDKETAGLRAQLHEIGVQRRLTRDAALRELILGTR